MFQQVYLNATCCMLLFLQLTNTSGIRNDVKECLAWVMFCFMLDQEHSFPSQVISNKARGLVQRLCFKYPPILTTFSNIPIPIIECLAVGYGIFTPKGICTRINVQVSLKCLFVGENQSLFQSAKQNERIRSSWPQDGGILVDFCFFWIHPLK